MPERRVDGHGTEVGVRPEELPKRQEAGLGTAPTLRGGERRVTHRPQQHGVGLGDRAGRRGWEGVAGLRYPGGTNGVLGEVEREPGQISHGPEHAHGLRGDLRPDPVAWEDGKPVAGHADTGPVRSARRRSNAAICASSSSVFPISSRPFSSISRR